MNRQKIEQRIENLNIYIKAGSRSIGLTERRGIQLGLWKDERDFLQSLLNEPEKPRSAWHNGQTYKFHGFFQGKNFSEELCPVAVLEDERGDITTEPANTIRLLSFMTNQETGYESKHKKTIEGAILRLRTDCREGAGTSPTFLEDVDIVLRHLESLKPTPLDAPTHSGLWWVEGVEIPVEYRHETKTVRESESGYVQYLKDFQNDHPGKWLPANNPFGKGEG